METQPKRDDRTGDDRGQEGRGPKFEINIEGHDYPWNADTITVPQIRTLGDLPTDVAVEEIDLETNAQRTLREDEIVHLKPGHGYSKKIKFSRG